MHKPRGLDPRHVGQEKGDALVKGVEMAAALGAEGGGAEPQPLAEIGRAAQPVEQVVGFHQRTLHGVNASIGLSIASPHGLIRIVGEKVKSALQATSASHMKVFGHIRAKAQR